MHLGGYKTLACCLTPPLRLFHPTIPSPLQTKKKDADGTGNPNEKLENKGKGS